MPASILNNSYYTVDNELGPWTFSHNNDGEDVVVAVILTRAVTLSDNTITVTYGGQDLTLLEESSYLHTYDSYVGFFYKDGALAGTNNVIVSDSSDQVASGPYGQLTCTSVSGLTGVVSDTLGNTGDSLNYNCSASLIVPNEALILGAASLVPSPTSVTAVSPFGFLSTGSVNSGNAFSNQYCYGQVYPLPNEGTNEYTINADNIQRAWVFIVLEPTNLGPASSPTISPSAGDYSTSQNIIITAVEGDSIKYSTDGTDPSGETPVISPVQFVLAKGYYDIRAIANGDGYTDSVEATRSINIFEFSNSILKTIVSKEVIPLYINCGGTEPLPDTTIQRDWDSDRNFVEGNYAHFNTSVQGHYNSELFQYNRNWWQADLQLRKRGLYLFPNILDGDYGIHMGFAEQAYGSDEDPVNDQSGVGKRIFDITINDVVVESNLDIFYEVGKHAALVKEYTTAARSNRGITIEFDASVDTPTVSYIYIYKLIPQVYQVFPTQCYNGDVLRAYINADEQKVSNIYIIENLDLNNIPDDLEELRPLFREQQIVKRKEYVIYFKVNTTTNFVPINVFLDYDD